MERRSNHSKINDIAHDRSHVCDGSQICDLGPNLMRAPDVFQSRAALWNINRVRAICGTRNWSNLEVWNFWFFECRKGFVPSVLCDGNIDFCRLVVLDRHDTNLTLTGFMFNSFGAHRNAEGRVGLSLEVERIIFISSILFGIKNRMHAEKLEPRGVSKIYFACHFFANNSWILVSQSKKL